MNQTKAQFIIAGQHGPKDHFVIADTLIAPNTTYQIDMNGDSIIDLYIWTSAWNGNWQASAGCGIQPESNNKVANGYPIYDNCLQQVIVMLSSFNINDTICNSGSWDGALDAPMLSSYEYNGHGVCEDNIFPHGSYTGYIGVQVLSATDTLYGWIKITGVADSSLILISYACNLGITGINEYQNNSSIKLYPDPAISQLTVKMSSYKQHAATFIINVLGQNVTPFVSVQYIGERTVIDVSPLSEGIYFVMVIDEKNRWVSKFMKE